ncbi:MAG: hypothetical protein KBA33_00060 [Cloacibacterium sp.]|nr:hypothetical protein [Cloacibacterium sp.]
MKKSFSFLLLSFGVFGFAQLGVSVPGNTAGQSKWTFGGYAGISASSGGGTGLYISPRVGYKIADNLEGGLSANLNWSNSSYYSSTMVGVGPFANYYLGRSMYISGSLQEFFVNQKIKTTNLSLSTNETALYLGGGYMQRLGERAYMQIGAMYNVLYNKNSSVFGGGFIPQIGIVYGL